MTGKIFTRFSFIAAVLFAAFPQADAFAVLPEGTDVPVQARESGLESPVQQRDSLPVSGTTPVTPMAQPAAELTPAISVQGAPAAVPGVTSQLSAAFSITANTKT